MSELSGQDREESKRKAFVLNNQAASFLREGRPEKALPLLHQALDVLPEEASVLVNLGGAYILLGRHYEATAVLTRASEIEAENPMIWCNLGAALLQLPGDRQPEDQEKAISAFQRALELDPKAANVAYNLGIIHRDREEWDEAAHCFRLAIEADPHDHDARSLLERVEAARLASDGEAPEGTT